MAKTNEAPATWTDMSVGDRYKLLRKGTEIYWFKNKPSGQGYNRVSATVLKQPFDSKKTSRSLVPIITSYGWKGSVLIRRVTLRNWPEVKSVESG